MNCPKCGMYNDDKAVFCTNCGVKMELYKNVNNNVADEQLKVGSITIIRPNNFVGCAIAFSVYVDNYLLGKVANGNTVTFPLYYGTHMVTIKHGFTTTTQQIVINDKQKNLVFNCSVKMGLVKSKIIFEFVGVQN